MDKVRQDEADIRAAQRSRASKANRKLMTRRQQLVSELGISDDDEKPWAMYRTLEECLDLAEQVIARLKASEKEVRLYPTIILITVG
jgi:hypothetical protein